MFYGCAREMMAASDGKGDLDSISADLWLMDCDGLHVMNMFSLSSLVYLSGREKSRSKQIMIVIFIFLKHSRSKMGGIMDFVISKHKHSRLPCRSEDFPRHS